MKPRIVHLEEVLVAAEVWWRSKRPLAWSFNAHLDHPTINCLTDAERRLAITIAGTIREGRRVA
jgi:hypothetical protein